MEISPEDSMQNLYQLFCYTLQVLASQPEVQCEMIGNYNTAWELRDDALAGHYLIDSGLFTSTQEADLLSLLTAIRIIPIKDIPSGAGRAANFAAMKHPAWQPIRTLAQRLIDTLVSSEQESNAYASAP